MHHPDTIYTVAVITLALCPVVLAIGIRIILKARCPERRERRLRTKAIKQRSLYLEKL
jgi:uncharacterized membrane protein